jgi:hypothetical protein
MKTLNFFFFLLMTSCASPKIWVESVANRDQKLKYLDGQAIVTSKGPKATVSFGCGPVKVAKNEPIDCIVYIKNNGEQEFDFSLENITINVDNHELAALDHHELKENNIDHEFTDYESEALDPSTPQTGRKIASLSGEEVEEPLSQDDNEISQLSNYLKITTIAPGKSYGGKFIIEELVNLPPSLRYDETSLLVKVKIGQEVHRFTVEKGFD